MLDFIIIGAGVAGLTLAHKLLETGCSVGLVSSDNHAAASLAAVGMSTMKGVQDPRDPFFASKVQGHADFAQTLADVQGQESSQIWQMGVWELFSDAAAYRKVCERIYHEKWRGHKDTLTLLRLELLGKSLGSQAIHKTESAGALYYPRDYSFSPGRFLSSYKKLVNQFDRLKSIDGEVTKFSSNEVVCSGSLFQARHIVIAAGASTPELLESSDFHLTRSVNWRKTPGITYDSTWNQSSGAVKWGMSGLVACGGSIRFGSDDAEAGDPKPWLEIIKNSYGIELRQENLKTWKGTRVRIQGRKPVAEVAVNSAGDKVWVLSGFHRNGYSLANLATDELLAKLVYN